MQLTGRYWQTMYSPLVSFCLSLSDGCLNSSLLLVRSRVWCLSLLGAVYLYYRTLNYRGTWDTACPNHSDARVSDVLLSISNTSLFVSSHFVPDKWLSRIEIRVMAWIANWICGSLGP